MCHIAPFRITASALAAVLALAPSSHAALAGQQAPRSPIPQESGAAGAPILRDCSDIEAALTRMRGGLGTQQGWIESAERQLRDAERGALDSESARREFFMDALKELATNQIEEALTLRRKVALLRSAALSPAATRKVLELAEKAETLKEKADELKQLADTAGQGYDFGVKLRENKATLEDFLKFADESGLAEEGISTLALVGGPVSKLAAESGKVLIDFGLTMYGSSISEEELTRARADLERMRTTYARNLNIIRDLQEERAPGNCASPDAQEPARDPSPEPEAPVAEEKGSSAMMAGLGIAAAAVGAGLLAGSLVPVEAVDETDDSGGNNTAISMTYVGNSTGGIRCNRNSGGIINNCTATITVNIRGSIPVGTRVRLQTADYGIGGNATTTANPPGNMTFNISGGTGTSSCPGPTTQLVLLNVATQVVLARATGFSLPKTCTG